MSNGILHINKQEVSGNYKFTGVRKVMTCGFAETFGKYAKSIAKAALELILTTYPKNADYLQTFEYRCEDGDRIKFWCINDVDHITFLLPEEY